MRRFRLPTIPNMGLPSAQDEGESLQACDSAIFADAEEEPPPPEKRPSAPHMSSLRRRGYTQEEERYKDASQLERPLEKRPSTTTRMKTWTLLAALDEATDPDERESTHHAEQSGKQLQNQDVQVDIARSYEQKNVSALGSGTYPIARAVGPRMSSETDKGPEICTSPPEQVHSSCQSQVDSSNGINTSPRKRDPLNELKPPTRKLVQIANNFRHRMLRDAIPELQRKAKVGLAFVVANIWALFSFLKRMFLTVLQSLDKIKVRQVQQDEAASGTFSSGEPAERNFMESEIKETVRSIKEMYVQGEKFSSKSANQKNIDVVPDLQIQGDTAPYDKNLATLSPLVTGETMTTVPRLPLSDQAMEQGFMDQNATKEHLRCTTNVVSNNSGTGANSYRIPGMRSEKGLGTNASASESSTETRSQGGNSAEDIMNELDQDSMRFEHRESEIIISPLDSTTPTFASEGEFGEADMLRMNRPRGGAGNAQRPRHLSELNQLTRLSGRKRGSRGHRGKLKNDVRTMKDSIFRVFGRNKIEPESRFASPRSARKTLALVADILVKEYGCDVAVRRNGALKMRCEKVFSGSQRLRVRVAFQPMDAFSCNVVVCRSREDDLQVSTTDYVAFVADLQRSFLNATSEGIHGTHSG